MDRLLYSFFLSFLCVLFFSERSLIAQDGSGSLQPTEIFKDALYEYTQGNNESSIKKIQYILKERPEYEQKSELYYWLGMNYKKQKNYAEAFKYFAAVKIRFPESYQALLSKKELEQLKSYLKTGYDIFYSPEYNELLADNEDEFAKNNFLKNDRQPENTKNKNAENSEPLISNVFFETDLRQALQDLSMQSGIPIIVDNSVQGYVTAELNDVPFQVALNRILTSGGYGFRKIADYYLVGSVEPGNPTFPLLSSTELIPVNYISASRAADLISGYYKPYIKPNDETNTISVTASGNIIQRIKESLLSIDVPPKQVSIEALITEVSRGDLTSAGIDWNALAESGDKQLSGSINLSEGLIDQLGPLFFLSRTETGTINDGKTSFELVTILKALVQDGKAEIKANPKIVTTNAQPANISITKDQYFSVITGPLNYPYTKLEKVSIGIFLTIKPFISENDEITVAIETEVSSAAGEGREGLPLVAARKATTKIRVKDGQFITIGGLTRSSPKKCVKSRKAMLQFHKIFSHRFV